MVSLGRLFKRWRTLRAKVFQGLGIEAVTVRKGLVCLVDELGFSKEQIQQDMCLPIYLHSFEGIGSCSCEDLVNLKSHGVGKETQGRTAIPVQRLCVGKIPFG